MGGRPVSLTLAARTAEQAAAMRATHTNERYFPGAQLPEHVELTTIDEAAGASWDTVVLAVPTSAFETTISRFAGRATTYLSLGKGLAPSGQRLSEVAATHIDPSSFIALSGPNIAREIMSDLPTAAVLAGSDTERVLAVQQLVNGFSFRVYANDDIVGVELAGATKNVIALAAGVLQGAGVGDNGVSAVMTRGLGEMARLGLARGARLQTYLGLAGVGDLMATCASPHSRNRRAGALLARGLTPDQVRSEIGQVVEGLRSAPIVRDMARQFGVRMNVSTAMADVAEGHMTLAEAARSLMSRAPTFEFLSDHEFV